MIKTYDMHVKFGDGTARHFTNISRVAVARYKQYFEDKLCMDYITQQIIVKPSRNEVRKIHPNHIN